MNKDFKIILPVKKHDYHWIDFDIEVGTVITRVIDIYRVMNPLTGITAVIPNKKGYFGIPFSHIMPMNKFKKTIIILHGFNSGPGEKEQQVKAWLQKNNLENTYNVIAPQLHRNPRIALRKLGQLIQDNYGDIHIIGTSLGGFYANYLRACNPTSNLKVHSINPSWNPSESLNRELNKVLVNYKTEEQWSIDEKYLDRIQNIEIEIIEKLKDYKGENYTIHLAKNDELLNFSGMLHYLDENLVSYQKFEYETNHRFEKIEELLNNIKKQLI